jgi:lipopolysaccharide transport system ATP-binding protein
MTVIRVSGLGKEYIIGGRQKGYETFRELLTSSLVAPFMRWRKLVGDVAEDERFWALKEVNFEVQRGDVLGIIGRNGAGKSTLLKILSRITDPTEGEVLIRGRIASLLEVGTGFHAELTGRENIFLNGAILGMSRLEIKQKFDQIVSFAEVEKFLDTPVKRYSSGMYVRLAFAIAAHLEPDILIVDEVLAVGDAEFQNKCLNKMDDVRGNGRTVVIVSHNIPMISELCRTAIWIDKGRIVKQGDFREITSDYLARKKDVFSYWQPESVEFSEFSYEQVSIQAPCGSTPDSIPASQSFKIEFVFVVRSSELRGRIALLIRNGQGTSILSSANTDGLAYINRVWLKGKYTESCMIPGHLLMPGIYYLTISQPCVDGNFIHEDVCSFKIDTSDSLATKDGRMGVIAPLLEWQRCK